jgi:DNA modification methylase
MGVPWHLAFALQDDGWYLRQDIIWSKSNPMPESVTDRCTKSHEYIFLLSKSVKYYYEHEAIKEPVAEATINRMKRGVSNNHKYLNGAPGQTPHTMNRPRPNIKNIKNDGQQAYSFHINHVNTEADKMYEKRNKRSVWSVSTKSYKGTHFATYPVELITPCILAGCPPNGIVLDPFIGSGTTGIAALMNGRNYIGIDLNPEYCRLARERIDKFFIKQ